MSYPTKTYELAIHINAGGNRDVLLLKEAIKNQLSYLEVDSFVEGCVDGLDIDFDHETGHFDMDLPNDAPIIVYKYDKNALRKIEEQLQLVFSNSIRTAVSSFDTEKWLEGWKDSFKPFSTEKFYVRPPWEKHTEDSALKEIIIEPAMAFGTGQHATTHLCLQEIEKLDRASLNKSAILDIGCGTGILSIAAARLGAQNILATDIDEDAILATQHNQKLNHCQFRTSLNSIPTGHYDIVFANILTVILKKILPQLIQHLGFGATVILSGVLNDEEQELIEFCQKIGLCTIRTSQREGWSCLVMEKVQLQ